MSRRWSHAWSHRCVVQFGCYGGCCLPDDPEGLRREVAAALEAARLPMNLSDWELWACAAEVVHQHGERAQIHVAERIGALALAGDVAGVEAWKGIARRMEQLRNSSTTAGVPHGVTRKPRRAKPSRADLNQLAVTAPDLPRELDHFYTCPACRQAVDRRQLGDVLWHEEAGHEPIPLELGFVAPMLPTLVPAAPEGGDWLHEIKYDGYRTQLVIEGSSLRAFTRNGYDWSDRYQPILRAASDLDCHSAIIDGEMIVQDEQGRSDFGAFKRAMERRPETLVFMAFDLLHLNGRDLRAEPLIERRLRLQDLVGCNEPSCCIQYSDHVIGNGADLFEAADAMGLEGIVSKRARSRYRSGRSRDWLKIKCFAEGEFVVIGIERITRRRPTVLLAREVDGRLAYAGAAMVTLANPDRDRFWRNVERLNSDGPVGGVT